MPRRVAVLALCALMGCSAWQGQGASAEAVLGPRQLEEARITLTNGSYVVLRRPRIVGDSVIGQVGPEERPARSAIATSDIRLIETRKVDAWRTGGLAIGLLGVVSAIALVVLIATMINAMG